MKPSSTNRNRRAPARNAALLNLLAAPGLGSLMTRRWRAGAGQLLLALAGFALVLLWFGRMMIHVYGQLSGDVTQETSGWLASVGAGLFALAWLWSLVTSVSLLREKTQIGVQSLEAFAAGTVKLDESKIISVLATVPQWRRNGEIISRTYSFKDFPAAMEFLNAVATLAEQLQHHPDMDVRWNKVTLAITTHEAGGLTEKDFALARQCDSLAVR